MIDLSRHVLGETTHALSLETSADNRHAAQVLVQQARRGLDIYTRDLDKRVFDDAAFLAAVRDLALHTRQTAIRILVKDSTQAVKYGHRLIPLCQRLSSFIEVRKPPEEYREYNEAFLIVDGLGCLHRKLADRYEGHVNFNAPHEARTLSAFFNEVWRNSSVDPALRRLNL